MNSKNPKNPGPNKEQSNEAALIADIINANKKNIPIKIIFWIKYQEDFLINIYLANLMRY